MTLITLITLMRFLSVFRLRGITRDFGDLQMTPFVVTNVTLLLAPDMSFNTRTDSKAQRNYI